MTLTPAERLARRREKMAASGEDRLKRITQSYATASSSDAAAEPQPAPAVPASVVKKDEDVATTKPAGPPPPATSSPPKPATPTPTPPPPPATAASPAKPATNSVPKEPSTEGLRRRVPEPSTPPKTTPTIQQQQAADELLKRLQTGSASDALLGDLRGATPFNPPIPDYLKQQQQAPTAAPQKTTLFSILRITSVAILALLSIFSLLSSFDVAEDSLLDQQDEDFDVDGLPTWAAYAYKIKRLTSEPLKGDVAMNFGVFGLEIPFWQVLVLVEVLLQTVRFLSAKRVKSEEDALLSLTSQMGIQMPAIYSYGKSVTELLRIWNSFSNDVSIFVFTFGIVVVAAHLVV
ncbi:hypothetical protein HDV05_003768 [Chytridiales sp. JEL 0842]|nr:hypothetical protein HDV05_003768 [Chytridiales sp. JEL 0842]